MQNIKSGIITIIGHILCKTQSSHLTIAISPDMNPTVGVQEESQSTNFKRGALLTNLTIQPIAITVDNRETNCHDLIIEVIIIIIIT